ncbi:hypothetical protein FOJ82_15805 [Tessaracoccus rhinocerotis]|uniref:Uncharacterized protein n=1 Tax=Tessaracoccus rhinocerotis TaxID=1689449 RepID=A0A553JW15_9ACTN|nr:hypothetical protein [Tessaracoccus rhinocerotis]TRY16645.1 hypothetical protein FOJ82_15805 [Tessaracoccus rhinocerotis]
MTSPTPRDAAPAVERRKELVAEAMSGLDGVGEADTAEQLARLDEAQTILAAVLNNQDVNQLGIPGVHGQP